MRMKIKLFILGTLCGLTLTTASLNVTAYNLPTMGDPSRSLLTVDKEEALGEKFMQAVRVSLPTSDDPVATDYIQSIGARLVAHSPRPSQHFYFFIVQDSSINAFSGPDGYIGVNSGLILKSRTESELASVMAHETGHVIQRHIMRGFTEQKWLTLSNIAGILAGIAVSTQNPSAGASIITSSAAGSYQEALNFSREFEREADNVGMQILANSNFNPCSMPAFFKLLAKETRLNDDKAPELLRSHPVTEDRLADAENRCVQYHSSFQENNDELNLIKARLVNAASRDLNNTARKYEALLSVPKNTNNLPIHYGYAIALIKARQYTKAQVQIDFLTHAEPSQWLFQVANAELAQQKSDYSQAIKILKALYQTHSSHFPLAMIYANILVLAKQYNQAREILEPYESSQSEDEGYLYLLSQAQGFSEHLTEAYMTRAKLYMLYGNKKGAIQQLQLALQSAPENAYLRRRVNKQMEQYRDKD